MNSIVYRNIKQYDDNILKGIWVEINKKYWKYLRILLHILHIWNLLFHISI